MNIEKKYPILSWAKDERPREKLRNKGVNMLSDAELLAILLHHGTKQKTAVDLGRELLQRSKQNLGELGRLSYHELVKINGIGEAKAVTIMAALELGRRRQASGKPGQAGDFRKQFSGKIPAGAV